MEVVSGVYQIEVPFPGGKDGYTNVYVLEGQDGHVLIDSGWGDLEAFSALREGLTREHLKFKDIKRIVITHIHPDHYGLAGRVKEFCGAEMVMHRLSAELIPSRYIATGELLEQVEEELSRNGVPMSELQGMRREALSLEQFVSPCLPDTVLDGGDSFSNGLFNFEAIHTPGHSPDHLCLYEPGRQFLFSGDHILPDSVPHVGLHPQSGDNPLGDYLASLQAVGSLKVKFVFPGHGSVFNGLNLRVEEIGRAHEQRKRDVLNTVRNDLKTAYQIAAELFWNDGHGEVAFRNLACWGKRMAVQESMAYLSLLVREDKVGAIEKKGVPLYLSKE